MAFPTTPVLDTFNRADGAPGANWSDEVIVNYFRLLISSNTLKEDPAAFGFDSNYWNPSTFGPDCEVYATFATVGTNGAGVVARLTSPGASENFYWLTANAFDTRLYKHVAGVRTQIGSTISVLFAAGDGIGLSCTGSSIECWRKPSGGAWGVIATRTDSDVSGAGYIGVLTDSTNKAWSFDDFGGGSIVTGGPADAAPFARAGRGAGW